MADLWPSQEKVRKNTAKPTTPRSIQEPHSPMKPPSPGRPMSAAPSSQMVTASSSRENATPRKTRRHARRLGRLRPGWAGVRMPLDYFLRLPRITTSVPASNARALPAEAGSTSGSCTAAVAAIVDPIPNRASAMIVRILKFLRCSKVDEIPNYNDSLPRMVSTFCGGAGTGTCLLRDSRRACRAAKPCDIIRGGGLKSWPSRCP